MPVVSQIKKGIQTGLNFTPDAPPMVVASIRTIGEGAMNSTGLLPLGPILVPIIPFGIPISMALQFIEALLFQSAAEKAKIGSKLMDEYYKLLAKAKAQRVSAEEQLFTDLKEAKEEVVQRYEQILEDITSNEERMAELQEKYNEEMAEYMATITPLAEKAKQAKDQGNDEEADLWKAKIAMYDPWYEDIALILVDIVQLRLDNIVLDLEARQLEPLTKIQIKKDWADMNDKATIFSVPVPYYPDLPEKPNLPEANPGDTQLEPCWQKMLRQAFYKWLTAPMVPPLGLGVGAALEMIRCFAAPLPPVLAADMESNADALKTQLGGVI